jgi:glycosyltransferase involved in cell wall biosynthesis
MGSPEKIGILINCLEVGGAQKMALQVFDLMERRFGRVVLLVLDRTRDMDLHPDPLRAAVLEKKTVHLSSLDARSGTLKKIAWAPVQYLRLLARMKTLELDLVISFEDRANMVNLIVLGRAGRIISVRHPMKSVLAVKAPLKAALIHLFFSLFRHRADVANFNSEGSKNEFAALFPVPEERTCVIHNFCDHKGLAAAADALPDHPAYRSLEGREVILACGRFKPVKGFVNLIRIFSSVVQQRPQSLLVLLGDGPLAGAYRSLVRNLGLEGHVVFTGFQSNTAPWIARARLFVLTSQSEGFPNVILEAMALKTAVVSVDCRWGPKEILDPESGSSAPLEGIRFAPFGVLTPPMETLNPLPSSALDGAESAMARGILALLEAPEKISAYETAGYRRSLDFAKKVQEKRWLSLVDDPGRRPERRLRW